MTDATIETVWRTPEGFIAPWTNWNSGEPNGRTGDAVDIQDCVSTSGNWVDLSRFIVRVSVSYLQNIRIQFGTDVILNHHHHQIRNGKASIINLTSLV